MADAMIAMRPKRTATQAHRKLAKADPALAALMVEWEADLGASLDVFAASLDREYELAAATDPAPPILDAEEKLAYELGRLDVAAEPLLQVADKLKAARDEAYMVLGDVEHRIAQRTLELIRMVPQAALPPPPPPPDSFDGGDETEDFHNLPARHDAEPAHGVWGHPWQDQQTRPAGWDIGSSAPTMAVRSDGWWRRVRGWLRPAGIAAAAILLAITAGGGS